MAKNYNKKIIDRNTYYAQGKKLYEQGKFSDAIMSLTEALKIDNKFDEAYYLRGQAYIALNKNSEALDDFKKCVQLKPNVPDYNYHVGRCEEAKGNDYIALGCYWKTLRLDFYHPGARSSIQTLWERCLREKDYIDLNEILDKQLEYHPMDVNVIYARARLLESKKQYEMALQYLQTALEIRPDFEEANKKYIELKRLLNKYMAQVDYYISTIKSEEIESEEMESDDFDYEDLFIDEQIEKKPSHRALSRRGFIPQESDKKQVLQISLIEFEERRDGPVENVHIIEIPKLDFSSVGGCDSAKNEIYNMIKIHRNKEIAKKLELTPVHGILLYGPTGCGKTHFAYAVGGELPEWKFYTFNCSSVMSKWCGNTERFIHRAFQIVTENTPSLLFIDEMEALTKRRDETTRAWDLSDVSVLLQERDRISKLDLPVLVIGATNLKELIDDSFLRPGRFTLKIEFPYPEKKERSEIFKIHLKRRPLAIDIDYEKLANLTQGYSGADIMEICNRAANYLFNLIVDHNKSPENLKITMEILEEIIKKYGKKRIEKSKDVPYHT